MFPEEAVTVNNNGQKDVGAYGHSINRIFHRVLLRRVLMVEQYDILEACVYLKQIPRKLLRVAYRKRLNPRVHVRVHTRRT